MKNNSTIKIFSKFVTTMQNVNLIKQNNSSIKNALYTNYGDYHNILNSCVVKIVFYSVSCSDKK